MLGISSSPVRSFCNVKRGRDISPCNMMDNGRACCFYLTTHGNSQKNLTPCESSLPNTCALPLLTRTLSDFDRTSGSMPWNSREFHLK